MVMHSDGSKDGAKSVSEIGPYGFNWFGDKHRVTVQFPEDKAPRPVLYNNLMCILSSKDEAVRLVTLLNAAHELATARERAAAQSAHDQGKTLSDMERQLDTADQLRGAA